MTHHAPRASRGLSCSGSIKNKITRVRPERTPEKFARDARSFFFRDKIVGKAREADDYEPMNLTELGVHIF